MDIDQILKEIDIISGSRKRHKDKILLQVAESKDLQDKKDIEEAKLAAQIGMVYALFLIEEKLEALNKIILYISKKDR